MKKKIGFVNYDGADGRYTLADSMTNGLAHTEAFERTGRLWVSQASVCARRGALSATDKGIRQNDAAFRLYCDIGKLVEDIALEGFENDGTLLFGEYILPSIKGLDLGGKIDCISLLNNKITVVEIKTCGSTMPTKPKKTHYAQAALYSAITGLPFSVFYQSRMVAEFNGKLKARQFDFSFSKEDLEINLFNALYANMCVEEKILPSKTFITKSEGCAFCDHTEVCFGDKQPHLDVAEHSALANKALKRAKYLLHPNIIKKRRNGVVKHISKHGTDFAKELLKEGWESYL